jgi:SOS-response transcriptional repressor LexA
VRDDASFVTEHGYAFRNAHGLTRRQQECLDAIAFALASGSAPSIREIGYAIGGVSTNGVECLLRPLERRGYITRPVATSNVKARGVRLTSKGISAARTVTPCPHCGKPEIVKESA